MFRLEQVFARAYNLRTSGCTLILVQTCGSAADPWDPDGTEEKPEQGKAGISGVS